MLYRLYSTLCAPLNIQKATRLIFVIFIFALPASILAIEAMSPEEITIRTEFDSVKKKLLKCVQPHKVESNEMVEYFCPAELNEMKLSRDKFNKFMLDKIASPAYKISRDKYQELEKKYSVFSEKELRDLHNKSCRTKWGSSDSGECQVIAFQIRKKEIEQLRLNKKN